MPRFINPDTLAKPFSRYSHVAAAPENCRWVHIAGQVGVAPDGTVPADFAGQARLAWANVLAAVRAGGLDLDDIVKVTIYITRAEDIAAYREARDAALQGRAPAATMVIVAGLAAPSLLIEVEAIAARAMPKPRAAAPKARARAKAKAKAKGKGKGKAKSRTKAKAKAKARPKSKAKAKGRAKAKTKTKTKAKTRGRRR